MLALSLSLEAIHHNRRLLTGRSSSESSYGTSGVGAGMRILAISSANSVVSSNGDGGRIHSSAGAETAGGSGFVHHNVLKAMAIFSFHVVADMYFLWKCLSLSFIKAHKADKHALIHAS
eukprot:gnl/TRDRNA2_/TRDRNA2_128790_c0_seq5.p1 gnl/TRDRNA2_/TRDRNA2_128790_c0~~gnl/TRDRNA2_/TRDRNA2_128790_c0_seq5.p1  ORF type:complete len:119 (-),score=9.22 gnl/TRDRNA2_/TRDRNA2_128790_c0_seq5:92-448(-)